MITLTSSAALNTQQVPVLVLQNNSIYCHVRGAPWSHQDLEPSWKSVTVPGNERLNPALISVRENLSGDKSTPSRAENCTVTSLPQHLLSHPFHGAALTIPHSQPTEFQAQLGFASCRVLSTSQLERIVYFNNQPGKVQLKTSLELLIKVGFTLASI